METMTIISVAVLTKYRTAIPNEHAQIKATLYTLPMS
jgi:hypothetical protein